MDKIKDRFKGPDCPDSRVVTKKCETKDKKGTHAPENLPIPAIAYFINTLDSQSSGCGRGGPNYFKERYIFFKKVPNFEIVWPDPAMSRALTVNGVYEVRYSWYG